MINSVNAHASSAPLSHTGGAKRTVAVNTHMKALILVGGFGTRLRPLTFKMAKPLVPFVNKPILIHQVEALKAAGVTEVVLAIAYQPDQMKAELEKWSAELGVKFHFSVETSPLGTAGPLALARELLQGDDEPFFVLNSDVTCKFPLRELLAHHKRHGKEGTIMVTQVKDWQKYGVVVYDNATFQIRTFAEKPQEFVGDRINAGIYIFNKSVLNRIPLERTSIETQVFPAMARDGQLYCMELEGFWADIGQPRDYLDGLRMFLPAVAADPERAAAFGVVSAERAAAAGYAVVGAVAVHPSATIAAGALLGPNVTIGANCKVGPHTRIANSAIFEGTVVGAAAYVSSSIIGWNNSVGNWARIENHTVSGDDVHFKAEVSVSDIKVLPNKDIKESMRDRIVM